MSYIFTCHECGGTDFQVEHEIRLIVKADVEYPTEDSLPHYRERTATARYSEVLEDPAVVCAHCSTEVDAEEGEPYEMP